MRGWSLLAIAALLGGVSLLAYSAAVGEGQVYLVLIFPVFAGTGLASFAGMVLIVLGIFLGSLSFAGVRLAEAYPGPAMRPVEPRPPPTQVAPATKRFGGIVFLGPFPIVFGSSPQVTKYMLLLGIALTVLLLAFFFLVLRAA